MPRLIGIAVAVGLLIAPAQAVALRYASPTGTSAQNCQTPATACDTTTAIQGTGPNVPSNGEEVVILTGSYPTQSADISQGASNLNIHGEAGQPMPVIHLTGSARWSISSGTLSYVRFEQDAGCCEGVSNNGSATIERIFMETSGAGASIPLCQCYRGSVRDSVFVTNNPGQPAIGAETNGGSGTATYRNVTAYSSLAGTPALLISNIGAGGSTNLTVVNSVALNGAGGPDLVVDGPNVTTTFSNSSFRMPSITEGGVLQDAGGNQTATPLFANAAGGDFSELADSPTVDAGITDPANGALDFAGNPRTTGGCTDIGAYEFTGPTIPCPHRAPDLAVLARKVKVNRKGKGALKVSCTTPAPEQCTVAGTLGSAGKSAKARTLGTVSGTVAGGATATITVKLSKSGRKRLARKGKVRTTLAGTVTGKAGIAGALSASLKLVPKRKR